MLWFIAGDRVFHTDEVYQCDRMFTTGGYRCHYRKAMVQKRSKYIEEYQTGVKHMLRQNKLLWKAVSIALFIILSSSCKKLKAQITPEDNLLSITDQPHSQQDIVAAASGLYTGVLSCDKKSFSAIFGKYFLNYNTGMDFVEIYRNVV